MSTVFKPWEGAGPTYGGTTLTVLPASAIYATSAPPSATPFSMRRKSILSGVVHRRIRGVGFIFKAGSVDRLTNIRGLDVMLALKYINDHLQRLRREGGGGGGSGAADGGIEAAPLEALLAGFHEFADKVYRPIIPIPLTQQWWRWLYHDCGICTITGKCWAEECPEHLRPPQQQVAAVAPSGSSA